MRFTSGFQSPRKGNSSLKRGGIARGNKTNCVSQGYEKFPERVKGGGFFPSEYILIPAELHEPLNSDPASEISWPVSLFPPLLLAPVYPTPISFWWFKPPDWREINIHGRLDDRLREDQINSPRWPWQTLRIHAQSLRIDTDSESYSFRETFVFFLFEKVENSLAVRF